MVCVCAADSPRVTIPKNFSVPRKISVYREKFQCTAKKTHTTALTSPHIGNPHNLTCSMPVCLSIAFYLLIHIKIATPKQNSLHGKSDPNKCTQKKRPNKSAAHTHTSLYPSRQHIHIQVCILIGSTYTKKRPLKASSLSYTYNNIFIILQRSTKSQRPNQQSRLGTKQHQTQS